MTLTDQTPTALTLAVGDPANGGSCVARYEGRVVFVRYALPGERVRVRLTADRGSYWHAEAVEVIEPSADRIVSLCPIAGVDGAGCCDLAFADPTAVRKLKGQPISWRGSAVRNGTAMPNRFPRRARPVGVPVSGLPWAPTAVPGFTATTATSWSLTCAVVS